MSKGTYPSQYPGHFITYSYLQNLHREQFVRAALMAESAGVRCDVYWDDPDVGLLEARTLVDIPVVGYGQASFHMASMLGDCIGVVNFLAPLADSFRQNAERYGLGGKLGPIVQTEVGFNDILGGFRNPEPVIEAFKRPPRGDFEGRVRCTRRRTYGCILGDHMGSRIGDVPIVDSFASGIKMCRP